MKNFNYLLHSSKGWVKRFCYSKKFLNILVPIIILATATTVSKNYDQMIFTSDFISEETVNVMPPPYPPCWPPEGNFPTCETTENYAPDPEFPEHTPLRYIKAVVHIFQKEDPNNLNQYIAHPTDPDNYTIDHLNVIQSWFDDPIGVNSVFSDLCDDPTDGSPHIPDARIRYLNTGTPGVDVFFHPDNKGWGTGYYDCALNGTNYGSSYGYSGSVKNRYITGGNGSSWAPFLPASYTNFISQPENQDAFHIFIARGTWKDVNSNGYPDDDDCTQFWPGGFVWGSSTSCNGNSPPNAPVQFLYGNYESYLRMTDPTYVSSVTATLPSSTAELGNQMSGELFHVLGIDHISPNQAHWTHANGDDGCEDTPHYSDYNLLGQNYNGDRCALTQCQIGKMHRFLSDNEPAFQRYPDGNGGFSQTPQLCIITENDIVIPDGANVVWSSPRNLKSNIIVEEGGTLTITCDLGLPENARISVKTGGKLIVDGAHIYNNCAGAYWDGIVVEGSPYLGNFPDFQGYCVLKNGAMIENANIGIRLQDGAPGNSVHGGIVDASSTTFKNCKINCVNIRNFGPSPAPSGQATGAGSSFNGCSFIINSEYQGDYGSFQSAVYLKNVIGIDFNACTFTNSYPTATIQERKDGIVCDGAGLAVNGVCTLQSPAGCEGWNYSEIKGFRRGIYVTKLGAKSLRVARVKILDNWIGVYAHRASNAYIINNEFEVGSTLPVEAPISGEPANVGLYLNASSGFKVEGNEFSRYGGGAINPVGILTSGSGRQYNEIYRNAFDNLHVGNLANGTNRGLVPEKGLKYFCNENSNNNYDFAVDAFFESTSYGISEFQGSDAEAAGNTFSSTALDPDGHFKNEISSIDYFCVQGFCPTKTSLAPDVEVVQTDLANPCQPKIPFHELGPANDSEVDIYINEFYNSSDIGRKMRAANMLITHYAQLSEMNNVRLWLNNKGGLRDQFLIVNSLLAEENTSQAQNVVDDIPNLVELQDAEEWSEYNNFKNLKTIQISAIQSEISESHMVQSNLTELTQIAEAGDFVASAEAQILINNNVSEIYPPVIYLPEPESGDDSQDGGRRQEVNQEEQTITKFEAIPNPANSISDIHYQLPAGSSEGMIEIRTLNGQLIESFKLNTNKGVLSFDTRKLQQGVYLYILSDRNSRIKTKRLIVL